MAQIIDGRTISKSILEKLPPRIQRLTRPPGLAVVLAGDDPASELYVRLKQKAADRINVRFTLERFPEDVTAEVLTSRIDEWNANPTVDAILVQLPLPRDLREQAIIERIDPEKDVDGFHPVNTARYLSGERTNPPGLIEGILRLIGSTGINLENLTATIVARESVFTNCLEHALALTGILSRTVPTDGSHHDATIGSDIVVVAAGKPKLIRGDDLKPGAIIIDVGINPLPGGKVVGDVDSESAGQMAGWMTPVPGGVGPMTIAMLLENVVRIAERNEKP